jgi:ABC-type multidrug transport system, ATPase component
MVLAIEAVNLVKEFGSFRAVDGVNLKVEEGVIFGLLGPNGAGKSTTIRMILGLLKPTSGYVKVFGIDVEKNRRGVLGIL